MTLEDGVYFDLDPEAYRNDPAKGSTDHKAILANAIQWQARRLKSVMEDLGLIEALTDKEQAERDAKREAGKAFGHAVHTMVLDGEEAFDEQYVVRPDMPEGLVKITRDQIRDALGDACRLPRSAALYDHVVEAKIKRPAGADWLLEDEWLVRVAEEVAGRQEMSRRWKATIDRINWMMTVPRADHKGLSFRERYLSGGQPEVSVFWTDENGVRLKCRFDYLRIKSLLDVKTYAAKENQGAMEAFSNAVETYAYDMQAMHYLEGRRALPALVGAGKVYGEVGRGWLEQVAAFPAERVQWGWLAVQTVGLPEVDMVEPDTKGLMFAASYQQVLLARRIYAAHRDKFGDDQLWTANRGIVQFDDSTFRTSMASRGSPRWSSL